MQNEQGGYNRDYSEDAPTFEQVSEMAGDIILEFGAPWCVHCQAAEPAIKAVLTTQSKLPHIKLYDGKGKPLGRAFKVKLWPTLILLHDGKEIDRIVRPLNTEEVVRLVEAK